MNAKAFLSGIYPRSEELVAATRDYDRGRITEGELNEHYQRDYAQLIALQREAGLDVITDGLLNWQDLLRPFGEIISGWEAGALVRYFDNNTFYRRPLISGALKLTDEKLPQWLERYFHTQLNGQGPWKATFPSPYFTAQAAQDEYYSSSEALMLAYTEEVLIPIIIELQKRGVAFVQLQEPWLVFHSLNDPEGLKALKGALSRLRRALSGDIILGLYTYFGDAAPYFDSLLEMDVDAVGVDFVETDLEALRGISGEKGLIAGCIDARSSWLEDPLQIARFVEQLGESTSPETIYVTNNADLELLPEAIARRKAQLLGEITRMLRG